jgi:hypothetical protein
MGIWCWWRLGAIPSARGVKRLTAAMSAGSIVGAVLGGLAVTYVGFLKALSGCVLRATAAKTIARHY